MHNRIMQNINFDDTIGTGNCVEMLTKIYTFHVRRHFHCDIAKTREDTIS